MTAAVPELLWMSARHEAGTFWDAAILKEETGHPTWSARQDAARVLDRRGFGARVVAAPEQRDTGHQNEAVHA